MRTLFLAAFALALCMPAAADSSFSGNLNVAGQLGVGNYAPQATLEARMEPADQYGLRVSSQDGTVLLSLDRNGRLAVGVSSPMARLDVTGAGDASDLGLQLRVGNSSTTSLSSQIIFAYGASSETMRHSIRTRHVAGQDLHNSMDFFLWRSTDQPRSLGAVQALSLQAVTDVSTDGVHNASVHIMPVGTPAAELVVSNSTSTGGGTISRAAAGTHSSRALKTDIVYMGEAESRQAYEDVRGLKHAVYRYKRMSKDKKGRPTLEADPRLPLMRGLIYEETPASIRGQGKSVVLDYRVLNLELASRELDRRIKKLEAEITAVTAARARGETPR